MQAAPAPSDVPSYWQRTSSEPTRAREELPRRAACVVVGGGFAGLATAIQLREKAPDMEVVVLEAEHVGFGASGRNAGFLSPVAVPIWLLDADRDPELAWALGHWRRELDEQARVIERWFPDAELRPSLLHLEGHSLLTDAGLVEFSRALGCAGIEHELSKSGQRAGRLSLRMNAFSINPYRLVQAMALRAEQLGVRLFEGARVERVTETAGGVELTVDGETPARSICADKLVLCTNAYTGGLYAGAQAWMLPMYSYMLASEPLRQGAPEGHFTVDLNTAETYHREHAGRVLLGGGDRLAPRGATSHAVPASVRRKLARHLTERFPTASQISDVWSGKLLVTPTGVPRIHKSPHPGRVVLNLGYGGTGVALTLALAKFAAAVTLDVPLHGQDARFFRVLGATRIPVWGLVRGVARVLVSCLRKRPSTLVQS